MRYHIKWTKNSAGDIYRSPPCNYHSDNVNRCHRELSVLLASYPQAEGKVEECHDKNCNFP